MGRDRHIDFDNDTSSGQLLIKMLKVFKRDSETVFAGKAQT
jgi:hypothetical protein